MKTDFFAVRRVVIWGITLAFHRSDTKNVNHRNAFDVLNHET